MRQYIYILDISFRSSFPTMVLIIFLLRYQIFFPNICMNVFFMLQTQIAAPSVFWWGELTARFCINAIHTRKIYINGVWRRVSRYVTLQLLLNEGEFRSYENKGLTLNYVHLLLSRISTCMYKVLLKYHKINIESYSIINYFYTFQFLVKSTT